MRPGQEETEAWIKRWDVRDSHGTLHYAHGIWTITSFLTAYVAFDDHPTIGRRAFYFYTHSLQLIAHLREGRPPKMVSSTRAGAGYVFSPNQSYADELRRFTGLFIDRVEPLGVAEKNRKEDDKYAVEIVQRQLAERGIPSRKADGKDEQIAGIDLVFHDPRKRYCGRTDVPVEVKSRMADKGMYDGFFLQLSETNREGRH
jgi:hypothetical protein